MSLFSFSYGQLVTDVVCCLTRTAYVQAALVTGEADTGESHFGVTTSAYVASDAGEDAVAAAEAIVFVPLCGGRGRIKRVALAEDAIGARAAQVRFFLSSYGQLG